MAFVVTYHSLAKNNIRNLYGGLPEQIKLRTMVPPSAMTASKRIREQYRRRGPTERFLDERYYEFDHRHGIRVPRAPAFRQLSATEVDEMVVRLSQPTVSKRRRPSDICEREVRRSFVEGCWKSSARSARSQQQVDEITSRVSLSTVTASVRNSLRAERAYSAKSVRQVCNKCAPSERFAREFSMYDV